MPSTELWIAVFLFLLEHSKEEYTISGIKAHVPGEGVAAVLSKLRNLKLVRLRTENGSIFWRFAPAE